MTAGFLPHTVFPVARRPVRSPAQLRREWIAAHEAGHAVAARTLGIGVIRASILPGGGGEAGYVDTAQPRPDQRRKAVIMCLAGAEAQRHIAPDSNPDFCARRDISNAMGHLAADGLRNQHVVDSVIRMSRREAEVLVSANWPQIKRLAEELLRRETMTGREIEELFHPTLFRDFNPVGADIICRRDASIQAVDSTTRHINVIWTTGATVAEWRRGQVVDESLLVTPEAVRLGRLNSGAPFLDSHNDFALSSVIGNVVPGSAKVSGGKGYARIALSRAARDADIVQKIIDGNIRNISVRATIHAVDVQPGPVRPRHIVTDWEPKEISAVPVGADAGAQVQH